MMEIAIIYNDDHIFVKIPPKKFIQMMEEFLSDGLSVEQSMNKIVLALKRKTLTV